MTTAVRTRFFEGGNLATVVTGPVVFGGALLFYQQLVTIIKPLHIDIGDVYGYVFNLYAIELGAVIGIFALFACRPTQFLERMKSTNVFTAIVANTNITLTMIVATLCATFILGLLKMEPRDVLELHSIIFLLWCWLAAATTFVSVRTVRLMMTALT